MKHQIIPVDPKVALTAIDRNDPEHAKTAIHIEWPETFSDRAQMVITYFDGTMFPFLYNNHIVLTDESLELTDFGDGSPEAPIGFPRYEDNNLEGIEAWLEEVADQFDNDGDTPGWEEAKAAFRAEERIRKAQEKREWGTRQIEKLRNHGAKIFCEGRMIEMDANLWEKSVLECHEKGFNAIMYEFIIPETAEIMGLVVYADGHVDSGSEQTVINCMENHWRRT